MIHHCLNKKDLKALIEYKLDRKKIDDKNLQILVENSSSWQDCIIGLTYLISQIIDKYAKDGKNCEMIVDYFYNLQNEMFIELQECDLSFIDFMLHNIRDSSLCLEEDLIDLQNRLSLHQYAKNLRF